MRLLASTDFALRILMLLSQEPPGGVVNVQALARRLGGLSRNHLHKIVQDLAALGFVQTLRGAGGGVTLVKSPHEIRIGGLVRALEADTVLVECLHADRGCCTLETECRLRPMLRKVQNDFYATLDAYTLADCVGQPTATQRNRKAAPR